MEGIVALRTSSLWIALVRGALALALVPLLSVLPAASAVLDPVPLPRLRPVALGQGGGAAAAATAVARPSDFRVNPNSPFNARQQQILANINAYFNSFRLMEGQFIQFGPNGEQSEGVFFLNRPGKIRFHFKAPSRLDVIADGSSVAIKDGRTGTQDLYPLSKTPLRYLLADRIDLTSADIVNSVKEEPDLVSVVIVQKSALVDGKLTMIFDRKTFELRQWIVTDAQGLNTSVAIFDTRTGKPQDPNLFRISIATRN